MKKKLVIFLIGIQFGLFSQNIQNLKISSFEVIVNSDVLPFNQANQFCRTNNAFLASKRSVEMVIGSYGSNIPANKFWTNEEVYMSSSNVDNVNKTIDYDAAKVFDKKSSQFNPENKSNNNAVICTKEIINDVQSIKNNLNSAIQLGSIKVYPSSMSSMSLDKAKAFCESLGAGWRLPTINELISIKQSNTVSTNDLTQPFYWSGTKSCDGCYTTYYALRMDNSVQIAFETTSQLRFIPVYSAAASTSLISTWDFGSYEVTTQFFGPMTISEALSYCVKATDNPNKPWKVTNMQELSNMKGYKTEIAGMIGKRFFSYENKSQVFNRSDMNLVKIEAAGYSETWTSGSEESRCYFFMSRRK